MSIFEPIIAKLLPFKADSNLPQELKEEVEKTLREIFHDGNQDDETRIKAGHAFNQMTWLGFPYKGNVPACTVDDVIFHMR